MAKSKNKSYTLSQMKDKYVGKPGTKERQDYEYELSMDVLGNMIRTARMKRILHRSSSENQLAYNAHKFLNWKVALTVHELIR